MKFITIVLLLFIILSDGNAQTTPLQWQKQTTIPYPGKQDDICFVNDSSGWYCNGQGKIYHTYNEAIVGKKYLKSQVPFLDVLLL